MKHKTTFLFFLCVLILFIGLRKSKKWPIHHHREAFTNYTSMKNGGKNVLEQLIDKIEKFRSDLNKNHQYLLKKKSKPVIEGFTFMFSEQELKNKNPNKCEWAKRDLDKTLDSISEQAREMLINFNNGNFISPIKSIILAPKLWILLNYLNTMMIRYNLICHQPEPYKDMIYDFTLFIKDIGIQIATIFKFRDQINAQNPCDKDSDCDNFSSTRFKGRKLLRCCKGFCTAEPKCPSAKLGELCSSSKDCEGKNMICCEGKGMNKGVNNDRKWGKCVKARIVGGKKKCPNVV